MNGNWRRQRWSGWTLLLLFALAGATALAWYGRDDGSITADAPLVGEVEETESGGQKLIALTFDDGPRRSTTTALLDGLAERGVKATFFLIGAQVEDNRDVVRRMDREGHQIGIHTYDHVQLTDLNRADFDAQVEKTRQVLKATLDHNDFLLRPPYGILDDSVKAWAGCPIILWSIDPEDWGDQNAAREIEHVVANAKDGSIILLHDIFSPSVEAALAIVDRLHAQGYLFVTVEELFAARHITLEAGKVYRDAYP